MQLAAEVRAQLRVVEARQAARAGRSGAGADGRGTGRRRERECDVGLRVQWSFWEQNLPYDRRRRLLLVGEDDRHRRCRLALPQTIGARDRLKAIAEAPMR